MKLGKPMNCIPRNWWELMLYNPFEPVTKSLFKDLIEQEFSVFVLQRFEWPGLKEKTGFLLSPYDDELKAKFHASQLNPKEGKTLQIPEDAESIDRLLSTGSGYRIFLNQIKEENWDKRMLKMYDKNIVNYLRTKSKFQRKSPIDILFSLENGRVVATISDGATSQKVLAIELLR